MIRPETSIASAHEADRIVKLIRHSFPSDIVDKTIYGCPGIAKYIANHISADSRMSDTVFIVARIGSEVIGCAEFRRMLNALWLSYIAVDPEYRGCGVARGLLRWAIERIATPHPLEKMFLDVFAFNSVALSWYERLGFRCCASRRWYEIPLTVDSPANAIVGGLAQANELQLQFGFSQLKVTTPAGNYDVGRLHSTFFRLSRPEAVMDRDLMGALKAMDPDRLLLVQLAAGSEPPILSGQESFLTSHNMEGTICGIRERL